MVEDKAELASLLEAEKSRRRLLEQRFSTAQEEAEKLRSAQLPKSQTLLAWTGICEHLTTSGSYLSIYLASCFLSVALSGCLPGCYLFLCLPVFNSTARVAFVESVRHVLRLTTRACWHWYSPRACFCSTPPSVGKHDDSCDEESAHCRLSLVCMTCMWCCFDQSNMTVSSKAPCASRFNNSVACSAKPMCLPQHVIFLATLNMLRSNCTKLSLHDCQLFKTISAFKACMAAAGTG